MAIAFDAVVKPLGGTSNPFSWNHTCTGSNLILIIGVHIAAGDLIGGVPTYNGIGMTFLNKQKVGSATGFEYIYYLINPPTGTNQIVISSNGNFTRGTSVSYTGVLQSGQPDASGIFNSGTASLTQNTSLTSIADNCWVIEYSCSELGSNMTAGTNTTERVSGAASDGHDIFDNNQAKTPAGGVTLQTTTGGNDTAYTIMLSIKPFVASTATASTLMMMGV